METVTDLFFRHNVISLNSMDSFVSIRGGYNNNLRDVYFVRLIGESKDLETKIEAIDRTLESEMDKNRLNYMRISLLPQIRNISDSDFYLRCYEEWTRGAGINLRNIQMSEMFKRTLENAVKEIVGIYTSSRKTISDTIIRNFTIKLFFWLDCIGKNLFFQWNEKGCIKVIADNVTKEQEYLFYQMLTYLGCDVMLIQNRGDIVLTDIEKKYSCEIVLGEFGRTTLEKYSRSVTKTDKITDDAVNKNKFKKTDSNLSTKVIMPERTRKSKTSNSNHSGFGKSSENVISTNENKEKSFEELAQIASSVVLIAIHDKDGDIIGTGSGIMIGSNGFILTNNHVASGGRFYSIRIEDDDNVYTTDEVIKYNSVTDLAVIRINRQLKPIPIYRGTRKLVRGQKVVAIGSPLGLFNSVSDGIISGFRKIDDVDMIQFTAPISHGSSGGAVINMYGEVIGISTAGIDSGQNINLAIGYENILMFAKGFY